ncbi:MAG TPA: GNAT family N-acetyltransferase [Thermoanaerobaculia bacterium]|nr:GNAT family N-acetyltransferase [Thermoanaerobaculia bacterium]
MNPAFEVVPGIAGISRRDWQDVAPPDDPLWTWDCFAAMEAGGVGPDGFEYLVWRDERGATAILPAFWFRALPLHTAMEQPWRGRVEAIRRWLPGFLSIGTYFCGHPLGCGRVLRRAGVDAPSGSEVLAAVFRRARERRLAYPIFKDFSAAEIPVLFPQPGAHGFFAVDSLPEAVLSLAPGDFEDYLAKCKLKARRNIRSNLRKFAAAGLRLERLSQFGALAPRLHELYEEVFARAPVQFDHLTPRFFAEVAASPGLDPQVLACFAGDRLVGFLLCLFAGRGGVCLRVGFAAEEIERRSRLYFVVHYEAIRLALERGCHELNFCQVSYPAKLEMGCVLMGRTHLATHTNALLRPVIRRFMPGLMSHPPAAGEIVS